MNECIRQIREDALSYCVDVVTSLSTFAVPDAPLAS